HTSSTPKMAQVAKTVGCGSPPNSFCGGDATTKVEAPASWAGTVFIMTDEGYTALPPGTYSPTRSTGRNTSVTVAPVPKVVVWDCGFCAACTLRTRSMETSIASLTFGSSCSTASSSACCGTRKAVGRMPSNCSL